MFKKRYQIPIYIALSLSLSACGGGSNPTESTGQAETVATVWQDSDATTTDMLWSDGSGQNSMKWSK